MVYGKCQYNDPMGIPLWINHSGRLASRIMGFGPQLVPQPGSLFKREIFNSVGGLDPRYQFAFDLDLFLRIRRIGIIDYIPELLAQFRWHSGSLSVSSRTESVTEASLIRVKALPPMF